MKFKTKRYEATLWFQNEDEYQRFLKWLFEEEQISETALKILNEKDTSPTGTDEMEGGCGMEPLEEEGRG